MSIPSWPNKDPDEVLDYSLDWSERIGTDVISTSMWTDVSLSSDLVIESTSFTTNTTTVWLSGGISGTTYTITNRIETEGGRIMEQSARLRIREK